MIAVYVSRAFVTEALATLEGLAMIEATLGRLETELAMARAAQARLSRSRGDPATRDAPLPSTRSIAPNRSLAGDRPRRRDGPRIS